MAGILHVLAEPILMFYSSSGGHRAELLLRSVIHGPQKNPAEVVVMAAPRDDVLTRWLLSVDLAKSCYGSEASVPVGFSARVPGLCAILTAAA
ncbi:hypothetical protein FQA47_005697 [Oryzias melastigma]|uniref:Uncharacterized protein n=1 Tax=Oryzias melastigma TaxID=30732 RepID=A0A834BTQ1_ORYME|nr:hypothetical protein FQA47_005697 [Oryzias melastigma]